MKKEVEGRKKRRKGISVMDDVEKDNTNFERNQIKELIQKERSEKV